jgi:hypothetical protein
MNRAIPLQETVGARSPADLSQAIRATPMPNILYIMGTGRTGTTILELLLASNPDMTGVGEVKHIFRDGFLRDLPCACGRSSRECELWSAVLQTTGWQQSDCERIRRAVEAVESHARFPLTFAGITSRKTLALYRRASEVLFRSVSAATHRHVVVDSSKYAGRALMLARLFPDSVKVLCITRSADGIIAAFQKKNDGEQRPKPPIAVAAYYLYVLLCMRLVRGRLKGRAFSIRFEDLNRDPVAVLRSIEDWSGYPLATARAKLAASEAFDAGHIVTGNRIRKKGKVKFEPSAAKANRQRRGATRVLARVLESYRKLLAF